MLSARNRYPFTASQWEELKNQALIFKYIMSGLPIPPQLISSLKTSFWEYSSSMPPTSNGWECFQMGFGRKSDPEPGRCRRTDGKKWRCSKEAYPESKYCEKHMHRGRNRSRKPVKLISPSHSISSATTTTTTTTSYSLSTISSSSLSYEAIPHHPFLYPSFSRPQNYNANHDPLLDSSSYSNPHKDYRYAHGMKTFSPEVSENEQSQLPNSYSPLTMSSSNGYSDLPFECLTENSKHDQNKQQEEKDQQHCYVLGTDFKSPPRPIKVERGERNQKPFHHFFVYG